MLSRAFKTLGNNNKVLFKSFSQQQKRKLTTAPFDTYEGGKKVLKEGIPIAWGLTAALILVAPLWVHYTDESEKIIYVWSDESKPKYMAVRAKPFPWDCHQCSLFDGACQKACKAEMAEKKAAWERIQAEKKSK